MRSRGERGPWRRPGGQADAGPRSGMARADAGRAGQPREKALRRRAKVLSLVVLGLSLVFFGVIGCQVEAL